MGRVAFGPQKVFRRAGASRGESCRANESGRLPGKARLPLKTKLELGRVYHITNVLAAFLSIGSQNAVTPLATVPCM